MDVKANLPRVEAVLAKFRDMEFETQETKLGDVTIKPSVRHKMKQELQAALLEDLNDGISGDICNTIINDDGMMMVVENVVEGFFTIELGCKFKNLDYEPLY